MAEINVERKKHHAWPWILGLLALALLVWAITAANNDGNDVTQTAPVTTNEAPADTGATTAAQDAAAADRAADTATDDTPPPR